MTDIAVMATGLRFPEGPVVLKDGSIALVEIARGTVSRVALDGTVSVIAEPGGGPNGLALGPDGMLYVCNNGGFAWHEEPGMIRPIGTPETYSGGRIERIDPRTGACTVLYESCGDTRLKGPNDIVFDRTGGFYFTDLGKARHRDRDQGSVYYARADGSFITECVHPILTPNGIGLSPDETVLYVAETEGGRLWGFDLAEPGKIRSRPFPSPHGGRFLFNQAGYQRYDSLAVEASGNICVATLMTGAITVISSEGELVESVPMPGRLHHQHLLRRGGSSDRLRDPVGDRTAGAGAMEATGVESQLRALTVTRPASPRARPRSRPPPPAAARRSGRRRRPRRGSCVGT